MMTLHSDSTALDRPDSVILPPGQPITLSVCLISAILNPNFPSLTWTNPSFIDSFVISLCKESIWSWIFLSNTLLTAHPLTDWSFSDWKSSKICSVWFYIWKSVTQYGARSPCWRLEAGGWSHVLDGHDILNGGFQSPVGHGRDAKKMVEVHG